MKTTEFDYALPPELIAQEPADPRDSARLMVLDRETGSIEHRQFGDITSFLKPGDLLVLNNTRVIPARLFARKAGTGGKVEILLLEQVAPSSWRALVGGKRVRVGTELVLSNSTHPVQATVSAVESSGQRIIEFSRPTSEWLWDVGHTPLPPYITRYQGDPERYQTVYSRHEGSAAAPTAGLHFTPDLLLALRDQGVQIATVTLRIGLDTFKPIDEPDIRQHQIHTEWAQLDPQTAQQINQTRLAGGRIVAVGTTTVRTLETAARIAAPDPCADGDACGWSTVAAFEGPTDLYITPGYQFRAVDVLITNFHLPQSTLIVLVAAFADLPTIKAAYAEAIAEKYRFYSFGDAMLIL